MLSFVLKRILQSLPVVFISSVVVFLLLHLAPGDPVLFMVGEDATDAEITAMREELGLDQPLFLQYTRWIGRVLRGDLGESITNRLPVRDLIAQRAIATLQLALGAVLMSIILAIPAGTLAALRNGGIFDWLMNGLSSIILSLPVFWVAIIAILIFSVSLGWLPPGGRVEFARDPVTAIKSMVLPATIMGLRQTAVLYRYVRSSILEILNANYIRTANAKGIGRLRVVVDHIVPNSLIPVVTIIGLQLGKMLGGAVIIESVFAWPGMGRLLVNSITGRDYPTAQGLFLVLAVVFIGINLITDIAYGIVDPRVRQSSMGR